MEQSCREGKYSKEEKSVFIKGREDGRKEERYGKRKEGRRRKNEVWANN